MQSKEKRKQYNIDNKERIRKNRVQWDINNSKKIKAQQKKYREDNVENLKAYEKQWCKDNVVKINNYKSNNPEVRKMVYKKYHENNKTKMRNDKFKSRYGITIEEYNKTFIQQEGRCAICGMHQDNIKKVLCIDHDHITKKSKRIIM